MAEPILRHVAANGLRFAVYDWPGEDPAVLLLHATGFHARCWDPVIARLNGRRCLAVDARGHGRSDKPPPPYDWAEMSRDTAALAGALELNGAVGVGHSGGGHALVRAAAEMPGVFRGLVLVDPVIFPEFLYTGTEYSIDGHFILNRRMNWRSAEEMFASFRGRGPFKSWQDEALRAYCDHALLPAPDGGGFVLACSPETEAHIYSSSMLATNRPVYDAVRALTIPVHVLRCTQQAQSATDLNLSPTAPDLAAQFRDGRDVPLPDNSHFIPMESPEVVAAHILEMC